MGMPITVELVDALAQPDHLDRVFSWFEQVDETFSTYKPTSEISRINLRTLQLVDASPEVQEIFRLAEETKRLTDGWFDIRLGRNIDPSGIVKGWAIERAADLLRQAGLKNFYVEAGGDIATVGQNSQGQPWRVGIRHPFNHRQNTKILSISDLGIATSGSYVRGEHIYNPRTGKPAKEIASLTVIGPNIYEADRFATAAYAMGRTGIHFLECLPEHEGYSIDHHGQATMTSGFERFILTS